MYAMVYCIMEYNCTVHSFSTMNKSVSYPERYLNTKHYLVTSDPEIIYSIHVVCYTLCRVSCVYA